MFVSFRFHQLSSSFLAFTIHALSLVFLILSCRIIPSSLHSSPFVGSLLCSPLHFYILSISFIVKALTLHRLTSSSLQGQVCHLSHPLFYPNQSFILFSLQCFHSLQIFNKLFLFLFSIFPTFFFLLLSLYCHISNRFSCFLIASHFTSLYVFFEKYFVIIHCLIYQFKYC